MIGWDSVPVNEAHAELLERQGIAPDIALTAGVRTIEAVEDLPDGLSWAGSRALPGLLFPWRSIHGQEVSQLRPDRPVQFPGDEVPKKYLWPKGVGSVLSEIRSSEALAEDAPVWIVEGSKQCLALASAIRDAAVYAVAGCRSWSAEGVPVADLAVAEGRDVIVAFDADLTTNPDVWDAAAKLDQALRAEGVCTVRYLLIPAGAKAGLDDVLGARPAEKRRPYLERLVESAPTKLGGRGGIKRPDRKKSAPSGDGAEGHWQFFDAETGGLKVKTLAAHVYNAHPSALTPERRGVAVYRQGVYVIDGTAFVACVTSALDEMYRPGHLSAVTDAMIGELYRRGRLLPDHLDKPLLNTPSGMLDLTTGELHEHSPDFLSMAQIPVPWDPEAKCPTYERWAELVGIGDQLDDLEETVAQMLDPSRTPPKAVFLFGPSRSGKSTFLRIMTAVAGVQNTSGVSLHQLVNNRFMPANLYGKILNASADLSSANVEDLSIFKMMTGEDLIQADRKYGGTFSFVNRALFAFSANELPTVSESSRAYSERIKPFRFGSSFAGHEDPSIEERILSEELPGVLARWVRAWQRRNDRGAYLPTDPGVREEFEDASDRVRAWVREEMEIVPVEGEEAPPRAFSTKRDLARLFNRWADANGGAQMGERKIVARLLTLPGAKEVRETTTRRRGVNIVRRNDDAGSFAGSFEGESARPDTASDQGPGRKGSLDPIPTPHTDAHKEPTTQSEIYICPPEVSRDGSKLPELPGDDQGPSGTILGMTPQGMDGQRVVFDIESASADQLWTYGPSFVRIAGWAELARDPAPQTTLDIDGLATALPDAARIIGHNVLGFDLLALAWYHGLDIRSLTEARKVIDTKLVAFLADPPPAKMNAGQIEKRYSLDTLAQERAGFGKTGDLKALAKEYGGYDQIPINDPRFLAYLAGDVRATAALTYTLPALTEYMWREHRVAALAAQMSLNGFRVDVPLLDDRREGVRRRKEAMIKTLQDDYGLPKTTKDGKRPAASPQNMDAGREAIEKAFRDRGARFIPKTPQGKVATSKEAMDRMIAFYSKTPEIIELAELVKALNGERVIYETVTDSLVGDRVHPSIELRQATGRWSTTRPGLTVMGKRQGRYVEREIFLPEPGHVILTADLAQVDARAIAGLSQDRAYMRLFEPGRDLHTEVAIQLFGSADQREITKEISHGWNYGRGITAIASTYKIPIETVEAFDAGMREQFPRLVEWQDEVRAQAASGELLDNGFGRLMRPEPDRAFTQGPALMGQGCARDLMMEGLLRLPAEVYPFLRAQVHDEVVMSVPKEDFEDVARVVTDALSFEWRGLQIVAEAGKPGESWGACYRK